MTAPPPSNLPAEEQVLGALMLARGALDTAAGLLEPDDFARESHTLIYRAALRLHEQGEPVDPVTLADSLGKTQELERAGGLIRLRELAALTPASANVHHYARLVREAAQLRRLQQHALETLRDVERQDPDAHEKAEARIYQLGARRTTRGLHPIGDNLPGHWDELVRMSKNPRDLLGLPTGLADLDKHLRGLRDGDLYVIAADTGRGKSALAIQVALRNLAAGTPVAYYSLEMSEATFTHRAIAHQTGVPYGLVERGQLAPHQWTQATSVFEHLLGSSLFFRDDAQVRPSGIRGELRRWRSRHTGPALAIVDYLQLLEPDAKSDSRTVDVASISRSLKVTAMDLRMPVLAVSQLRRRQTGGKPNRNDLRESGSIENDASVVLLIHHPEDAAGTAELLVAKNRHGAEAVIPVAWRGETMRFGPTPLHSVEAAA